MLPFTQHKQIMKRGVDKLTELTIRLKNQDAVKKFFSIMAPLQGDFELVQGRSILDARSLMGIFSLDLESPMILRCNNTNTEAMSLFKIFEE